MDPGLMTATCVGAWPFTDGQTVVNVPPVLRRRVDRIDVESLNGVDRLQDLFDIRPPGKTKEALSAGAHVGDGRVAFARSDCAQDVHAGDDSAVVVRRPADECKDAAGRKRDDTALPINHMLFCDAAEADPVLDALFEPRKLDMSE